MAAGYLLGRQDSLHCAEPSMAGGLSVKVEEHGEDCRRAGAGGGEIEARVAWPCGGRVLSRAALLLAWSETAAGIFPRSRLAARPNPSPRRVVYPTLRAVSAAEEQECAQAEAAEGQ